MFQRALVLCASLAIVSAAAASTVPLPIVEAVHGRAVGWSRSGSEWFVVYLDRVGSGRCGLDGASWRMALVATVPLPAHVVADRRISGAMCGNYLAWVRAGRFSDGRHREAAFMLWTTPSIGATTWIYRIDRGGFERVASFSGDRVVLTRGRAVVEFENRARSPHGELQDVYRFSGGRYRLVRRR